MTTVDMETWWQRLGSAALVGTARRAAPSLAELDLGGTGTPAPRSDARPEEAALDAAAVGGALRRAGRLPATGNVVVPAAAPDPTPEAPPRARQLLELLLTQPPTDATGTEALLLHWCTTCRETGHRVPHRLLPLLLDRATSLDLRRQVSVVVGERGVWLAGQNRDWSWLHSSQSLQASLDRIRDEFGPAARAYRARADVDPHQWALLPTERRAAELRRVRGVDPAAGRDLLLTGWTGSSAKDRRVLLEALEVGLGPDDEDLLDDALDDRAASVRELAARLLDGLPGSRRAARMAERLRPLIREVRLLRRKLEIRLPDDPDAAGRRDGLGKPPPGRSSRGWWLEQIVAGAPFDVWAGPADEVVPRIEDDDVLAGLRRATAARQDHGWARALLDLGSEPALLAVLAVLPEQEREARVIDELGRASHTSVPGLLQGLPLTWSPQLSAAVVGCLARLKPEETGPLLERLMPRLVRCLHQDAAPALQRWRSQARLLPRHDDQLGSLIQSRTLRQTISEAFQT